MGAGASAAVEASASISSSNPCLVFMARMIHATAPDQIMPARLAA
jgi:hypothetical protein